jgi:hypothetical protein
VRRVFGSKLDAFNVNSEGAESLSIKDNAYQAEILRSGGETPSLSLRIRFEMSCRNAAGQVRSVQTGHNASEDVHRVMRS